MHRTRKIKEARQYDIRIKRKCSVLSLILKCVQYQSLTFGKIDPRWSFAY